MKKLTKLKKYFIIVLVLSLTTYPMLSSAISNLDDPSRIPLGKPYLSNIDLLLGNEYCVLGGEKYDPNNRNSFANNKDRPQLVPYPKLEMNSNSSQSVETTSNKLIVSVSGSADAGIASINAKLWNETALLDSEVKISNYTTIAYIAGNAILTPRRISQFASRFLEKNDYSSIIKECGNELVYQVQLGARLVLGLEFNFDSVDLKNKLGWLVTVKAFKAKKTISSPPINLASFKKRIAFGF
ncbi:MAG: hypothetical protein HQK51_06405 [Oligoflexia bacterium]|nr:hypothetical protein [Oligoflexia bacterium]